MELIPKALIGTVGGQYINNQKTDFHLTMKIFIYEVDFIVPNQIFDSSQKKLHCDITQDFHKTVKHSLSQ
jgi:hypothetical protein